MKSFPWWQESRCECWSTEANLALGRLKRTVKISVFVCIHLLWTLAVKCWPLRLGFAFSVDQSCWFGPHFAFSYHSVSDRPILVHCAYFATEDGRSIFFSKLWYTYTWHNSDHELSVKWHLICKRVFLNSLQHFYWILWSCVQFKPCLAVYIQL
jgi:hypothetical protein